MTIRSRISGLALNALVAIAAAFPALVVRANAANTFSPYSSNTPPQRAQGDFDGDGRVDTALIQERAGIALISIQLSGSSSTVDLEGAVTSVVESDVDHDGDLDLVAATSSGDLLIWINDGRGRFTRQLVSSTRGVSGGPVVVPATGREIPAINAGAPPFPTVESRITTPAVGHMLASVAQRHNRVHSSDPPPLRGPPARSL
jgi:hypothetical protein